MFKLDKYTLSGDSITRFNMPALGAKAVLLLSPALECNSQYYNAMLKMSAGLRQGTQRGSGV